MRQWWVDPLEKSRCGETTFADIDRVFVLQGDPMAADSLSDVIRVSVGTRRYYVKRYQGNGKDAKSRWFGLRQWWPFPRVRKEWENLLAFRNWGIPTARLVAYGLERRLGGFQRGALVTEEISGTTDLARIANNRDARLQNGRWVRSVALQIARMARTMHSAGFAHNDLKWRNLLVTEGPEPRVFLIDCPSGGYWWGPFLRYRIIKDLACLDKIAKCRLSRTQRLRFYLDYTGHRYLTSDDKRCVRKILDFFAGRE